MKITSFSFTLRQAVTKDGYGDNYYVTIDENGNANINNPYKNISHKEQAAILGIIQNAISKYSELAVMCDRSNRILKLEEYAPKVSVEQTSSESAAPQSCALGDGEVSTGIKDAPFEEVETAMDKAKTHEEMLEAMIASGKRKEVRDLPM
jgi:hypothetical protein